MKTQTMFYVVTRKLGECMQGSKAARKSGGSSTPKGTIYATMSTRERAEGFCAARWGQAAGLMIGNTILIIEQ